MIAKVAANSWLFFPRPEPQAKLRMFCFHHAGGSAIVFRSWVDDMPASVEVAAVQLPGRANRFSEPLYRDLNVLITDMAEAIAPWLTLPFVFFGHSNGALISFELTRFLRRMGMSLPRHLFVAARRAPHIANRNPPVHHLPDDELIDHVISYNGTTASVAQEMEMLALLLPVVRADFALNDMYEYEPEVPLPCPISAFGGEHDHSVSVDDLSTWRDQTSGPFRYSLLPGDHFFLRSEQSTLIQTICQDIAEVSCKAYMS